MALLQSFPEGPEYRICSYSHSNAHKTPAWFLLQLRLNGKRFSITAWEPEFRNSPRRILEFQEYLAYLASDKDKDEHSTPEPDKALPVDRSITIHECFAWAVRPFIESFRGLSPGRLPVSKITLQDFFNTEQDECRLGAMDDCLVPGSVELLEVDGYLDPEGSLDTRLRHGSTLFPTYNLREVETVTESPENVFDDGPSLVLVHGQEYFFKSFEEADDETGWREIETYEKITMANFGPEVRTSRLFGIAQDDQLKVRGLLLHRIQEETVLEYAVAPETPKSCKIRWGKQVTESLEALHAAGITWGDAKAGSVIIDNNGNAWIVDFGGGYTAGWVGKNNSGTIEGDLEGLRNIMKFLEIGS